RNRPVRGVSRGAVSGSVAGAGVRETNPGDRAVNRRARGGQDVRPSGAERVIESIIVSCRLLSVIHRRRDGFLPWFGLGIRRGTEVPQGRPLPPNPAGDRAIVS